MNILVTGAWQEAEKYITELESMENKVIFMQCEKNELPCEYGWVEGVICNGLFLYHDVNKFTNLKYIQLTSAGYDRVPIEYLNNKKIKINNARGVYSIPMAEFAVFSILQFYKQSRFFYKNQSIHKWEKNRNLLEMTDKKVCIIGCGSVGTECAKRFVAFGCDVIGVDLTSSNVRYFKKVYSIDNLDVVLKYADVVVLTLPLTEKTYHLIDREKLCLLKEGCTIVNIARGAIVDNKALIECLKLKKLNAAIDVFEDEPLMDNSPLWSMENVILTPHNSFVGDINSNRLHDVIIGNLKEEIKC